MSVTDNTFITMRFMALTHILIFFMGCAGLPSSPPEYYAPDEGARYLAEEVAVSTQAGEGDKQNSDCLDKAIKRIMEIRTLPEKKHLYTLDGQNVLLNEFYEKCLYLFPQCNLFKKFYYWKSEIREVVSGTENGALTHKIRCYNNCLSTFCPESCDPRKTHGDVAEFYDQNGKFMGLAVYMGNGEYCSLPYDGYKK